MIYNFRRKPSFPSLVIPFQISLCENMLMFSLVFFYFLPLQDRLTASVKKNISHTPFSCQLFFIIFSSFFVISKKKREKSLAATYFPADAVSSALESLTSVFGMGTGITSPLWPPGIINIFRNDYLLELIRFRPVIIFIPALSCRNLFRKHILFYLLRRLLGNDNMVKPHDLLVLLG